MLLCLIQGKHGFSSISGLLNCDSSTKRMWEKLKFFKRINVGVVGSKFSLKFRDVGNRRCV